MSRTTAANAAGAAVGSQSTPPTTASKAAVGAASSGSATVFQVGVTHTQISADSWWDTNAVKSARDVLNKTVRLQNQHLMGWGTLNPEPSKGVYDWTSLDERINLIRATGSVPVITLCCAPDWMKGGQPGATDWSRLEVAPLPEHYDDYAQLAAAAAARYPDVKYFQVWNELKGFYLASENRWNYEAYTDLYNRVYDAVRAVRPDAKIGGPYVVMDSWASATNASNPSTVSGPWGTLDQRPLDVISYWLAHAHGADFIAVDGDIETKDGQLTTDPNTAIGKFAAVNTWIRQHTSLPIWWSEFYLTTPQPLDASAGADLMLAALKTTKSSGAAVVLLWDPNGTDQVTSRSLWTDVRNQGGGQPTPLAGRLAGVFDQQ